MRQYVKIAIHRRRADKDAGKHTNGVAAFARTLQRLRASGFVHV